MAMTNSLNAASVLSKDDQIVIGGVGGFSAGVLTRYFHGQGFTRIRGLIRSLSHGGTRSFPGSSLYAWT